MYKNIAAGISTLAIAGVLASSAVAQANPATTMAVIEDAAVQLCSAMDRSPDMDGVIQGMSSLEGGGIDEMDAALIMMVAMHHGCPQHEALLTGVAEDAASEEICGRAT